MDSFYTSKHDLDNFNSAKMKKRNRKTNKNTKSKTLQNKARSKKSSQKPAKEKGGIKAFVICLIIFSVIAIGAVAGFVIWENRDVEFTFSENVSVSGINISELTYEQAKFKVEKKKDTVIDEFTINITAKEFSKKLTRKDFTYKFYVKEALKEAKVYSLKEQGRYEGEDDTEFVKLENPDFELRYKVEESSVSAIVKDFAHVVNREFTNARVKEFVPFAEKRFIYQDAVEGYQLVEDDLIAKIDDFFASGASEADIVASVNVYEPERTVEDLRKNIVGLSKATSVSYNTPNGNTNMRVALAACNGSVIEPGEVWSFNECTGDSNLESNGYKKATVISQQQLTDGVGGGICQASTTIFRAAAFANMTIYERYNHFWASSYAFPGEDATIDYPNLDLRLFNPTDYQMFIECKMEDTTLIVNIYGYQEPYYDNVKLYSVNHDKVKQQSYKTTTYRVLYLDGKVVKEEVLCNSTYSLKDGVKVKAADKGTYRTMVDGTVKYEEEPEKKKKKKKKTETTQSTEAESESTTEVVTDSGDGYEDYVAEDDEVDQYTDFSEGDEVSYG